MLVGTTFAGADWNSGSMSNQLLFEPRRSRVWLAKAAAVLVLAVVTSAVLLAAFWGALALLAQSRDIDVPPEVPRLDRRPAPAGRCWSSARRPSARTPSPCSFRSTVFTLGAMFAVVVGATILLALLGVERGVVPQQEPRRGHLERHDLLRRATRRLLRRAGRPRASTATGRRGSSCGSAARNLGVVLAGAVALSMWSFRRRDVP